MESLRDRTNAKMVKQALEALPKGSDALSSAYDGAVQRVEHQREGFRLLATRLFGWLTYSERLMTVKEVQHALAIEPETSELDEDNLSDIDEIVGFCAGLVIIDEETQIIRLVHYTTQEYFRRNGDRLLASAQQDIAISCLTYLLYDQFENGWVVEADFEEEPGSEEDSDTGVNIDDEEDGNGSPVSFKEILDWPSSPSSMSVEDRLLKYPFLGYAAIFWAYHASVGGQQMVTNLMMNFVKDDRRVSNAGQVMLALDLIPWPLFLTYFEKTGVRNPLSAMHVLVYQGHVDLITELLNQGFEADAKDLSQKTPLWWAAWQGQRAVVELLLSQSHVNVNSRGLTWNGSDADYTDTPLGVASSEGKDGVVELLIEREDVDVNLSDGYGVSPLKSAARGGYSTIVKLLLKRKDIDVNSTDMYGGTPLLSASHFGYEDIVRQLLNREDIQINAVDKEGKSPLAAAADRRREGNVRMLLGHENINLNIRDGRGWTPLIYAVVHKRNEAVIKLLLSQKDIKVNHKDDYGQTVLHYAARRGSASIVKLLIPRIDVEVNSTNKYGQTPLHVAVDWSNEVSTRTLFAHAGIEVNAETDVGRATLAQARIDGSAEIVELLCDHPDIDLTSTDNEGKDVCARAKREQEAIANSTVYEEEEKARILIQLEECLHILRTAIAKRSREQA